MENDWEAWRSQTLAQAKQAQLEGKHFEARALAAMVRDSVPQWAKRSV